MAPKKQLDELLVEQFRKDWDTMSYQSLQIKYKLSVATLTSWSKIYNCKLPKKRVCDQNTSVTKVDVKITPQEIMSQMKTPDFGKVGLEHIDELKACNEEFMRVINDTTMAKRERDDLLFSIAERAMGIFISQSPTAGQYNEGMYNFYKLKLYEKKVGIADKEEKQIDAQTLKSLKKKFIQEAMDAIVGELSVGERRFFEHLVNMATKRILDRKKKANESMQQRAIELNGHVITPEPIIEPPIVNAEIISS